MAITSFTVKKNIPTQQELDGEYIIGDVLHNRIFTNCKVEVKDNAAIIKNEDDEIEAVFSLNQFSIIK